MAPLTVQVRCLRSIGNLELMTNPIGTELRNLNRVSPNCVRAEVPRRALSTLAVVINNRYTEQRTWLSNFRWFLWTSFDEFERNNNAQWKASHVRSSSVSERHTRSTVCV